jgi:hypothetical protein
MSEVNKQQNKTQEMNNASAGFNVSGVTLFKDKPNLVYLYKKTEKLVSALYLLSGFISDKEPIKWHLRESGVELLSCSLSLSINHLNFVSTGLRLISLLEISYIGGIISKMNYDILKYELENMIRSVESGEGSNVSNILFPENFFAVSGEQNNSQGLVNNSLDRNDYSKGHNIMSDRFARPLGELSVKPFSSSLKPQEKSNRQETIVSLLKKNKELGIKDFVTAIKGCSEKTIQRELVVLVSKGQVKKTGQKRWSRYSIKE